MDEIMLSNLTFRRSGMGGGMGFWGGGGSVAKQEGNFIMRRQLNGRKLFR
jgi:hypothetical protein